jgi:hypothetical protein
MRKKVKPSNNSNLHRETFLTVETYLNGELLVNDDMAVSKAIYEHNSQQPEEEEVEQPVKKRRVAKKQLTGKEIANQEAIKLANQKDLNSRNIKTPKS